MKSTRRKVIIIILFILTVLIGISAIYIGARLSEQPSVTPEGLKALGEDCTFGRECGGCDYPQVSFCSHPTGQCGTNQGKCECRAVPQSDPACGGTVCSSLSAIGSCTVPECPTGTIDCGFDGDGKSKAGCTKYTDLSCDTTCSTCGNQTTLYRYCKGTTVTPPGDTGTPVDVCPGRPDIDLQRCAARNYFGDHGFQYPNETENNFRFSWFDFAGETWPNSCQTGGITAEDYQVKLWGARWDFRPMPDKGGVGTGWYMQDGITLKLTYTDTAGNNNILAACALHGNASNQSAAIFACDCGNTTGTLRCSNTSGDDQVLGHLIYEFMKTHLQGRYTLFSEDVNFDEEACRRTKILNVSQIISSPTPTPTRIVTPTPTPTGTPPVTTPPVTLTPSPSPTPQNGYIFSKGGTKICDDSGDNATITYSVNATNTGANPVTVTISDNLDNRIQDSWVVLTSITNGGVLSNNVITWTNLSIPANSTITLTYQVIIPRSSFGNNGSSYTNTVTLTETGQVKATATYIIEVNCTPGTALISDEVDRILLGLALIIAGMLVYRYRLNESIGQLFWNAGVKNIAGKIDDIRSGRKKKQEFEEKMQDKVTDKED